MNNFKVNDNVEFAGAIFVVEKIIKDGKTACLRLISGTTCLAKNPVTGLYPVYVSDLNVHFTPAEIKNKFNVGDDFSLAGATYKIEKQDSDTSYLRLVKGKSILSANPFDGLYPVFTAAVNLMFKKENE